MADIEAAGGTAHAVVADITDQAQAEQAVVEVIDRFGRLVIQVNNAGLMLLGPIVGADVEEWERMIAMPTSQAWEPAVRTEYPNL